MRYRALVILILFVAGPAWGLKEYYALSRSVRAMGMGGAFYGLSDDQYALFYNPAGLGLYAGSSRLMFSGGAQLSPGGIEAYNAIQDSFHNSNNIARIVNQIQQLQGKPIYAATGGLPFYLSKNVAVGLLVADTKGAFGFLGSNLDTDLDITILSDSGIFVGYGGAISENWYWGITGKGLLRAGGRRAFSLLQIAQSADDVTIDLERLGGIGGGIDFDLGAIYVIPNSPQIPEIREARISFTLSNVICAPYFIGTKGNPPILPRYASLGFFVSLQGFSPFDEFHFLVDVSEFGLGGQSDPELGARDGSFWKHVNWGIEAPVDGWWIPRVGFHQGLVTVGLGLNFQNLRVDLAYYGEELARGINRIEGHRFAATLTFGLSGV